MRTLLFMTLLSFSVNAATTGTLVLLGNIPKKVDITVTSKSAASSLDLENDQTNLSVATLTGKSNVNAGYKISMSSANGMKLTHTTNALKFINYTLKLDSTSLSSGGNISYSGKGNFTNDVNISYTGVDGFLYDDGNYTDTLTFTITAN